MGNSLLKIIVIAGPTASGKSNLAVWLAQKINGEVISADSRQVYKGLNIGTAKISKKEMKGIPHHLLDVVSPQQTFTAHDFKEQSEKVIEKIIKKNKVPIVAGGTGFYIQTLVDNYLLPEVPPNKKLRKELEKKTTKELFLQLAQLDLQRASTIDVNNPHRLMRAIEIATYLGKVPEIKKNPKYDVLQIGIETDDIKLKEKISKRLTSRIKVGMIKEAEKLHTQGLSWKRMEELGLEYRYMARYLQGLITQEQMIEQLEREIWHYAKRQKTWFKRDERIVWFPVKAKTSILKHVRTFLGQLNHPKNKPLSNKNRQDKKYQGKNNKQNIGNE